MAVHQYDRVKEFYYRLMPTLTPDSWAVYEQLFAIRHVKKGELILRAGSVCNYGSFINYGLVKMYYLIDGKENIAAFFAEGNYFSDYESFLTREPSLMYLEALEDTELIELSYDSVQYLYSHVPECEKIGRLLAEQLFILSSKRSSSFLLDTPEVRYRKLLDTRPFLFQRVPQYMIASYLGVSAEALSRIRARLNKKM